MPVGARNASANGRLQRLPTLTAGVIVVDADLRIVDAAGAVFARPGYRPRDWLGRPLMEILPAGSRAELEPRYRAALGGELQSFEFRSVDQTRVYWVQIVPLRGEAGAVMSVVAVMEDITERLAMIDDLSRSQGRLRESERLVGVGSWEWFPETDALSYSPGFALLLGLDAGAELDGAGFWRLVEREDRHIVAEGIEVCTSTGAAVGEFRVRRADGAVRLISSQSEAVMPHDGQPGYQRGAIVDVTEARAAERERLHAVSLFRQAFDASPIGMAMNDPRSGAFIEVNDAMCSLMQRSRSELLALSADAVTHPDDRAASKELQRKLADQTTTSCNFEKRYLRPDGSNVWVNGHVTSVHDADGTLEAFFCQFIDIAERKDREAQFEAQVSDAVWLGRIRDALDRDRFVLYSQPIVDLFTGETVQQELLIRMLADDGSVIAPSLFLPVAERYGLISEIDRWVIREAVKLAAHGEAVEFNLSGASIGDPDILRELSSAIKRTGADPSLLVVEVTETAMMDRLEVGRRFAERVAGLGCRLALDDFGTGYASLTYLKQIPAEHLKIDTEFVRDLAGSNGDERLVRGIIGIAREFSQTTVAEGIEDHATLVRLRELGADFGQGYLFGAPAPLADSALVTVTEPRADPTCADPVGLVRAAFAAFAARDFDAIEQLCMQDIVLRPHITAKPSRRDSPPRGRDTPYRGHDGIRAYLEDVGESWDGLRLTPLVFRRAQHSVIVFGHADPDPGTTAEPINLLWVWQFRDGLIASAEAFQTPKRDPTRGAFIAAPRRSQPNELDRRPNTRGRAGATPGSDRLMRAYVETLRAGDTHAAAVVLDDALDQGLSSVEIHSRVIAPAMWSVGDLWERGSMTVAEEHLATAISHHVLARVYPGLLRSRQRRGDTIVMAAVDGEHHVLGLRMAADVLEGAGFDVRFLGADVPESSMLAWVGEHRPAAVALGLTMPEGAATLAHQLQALRDSDPEMHLIVGGQGVPLALRESAGVFYAADTERLAEHVRPGLPNTKPGDLPPIIATTATQFRFGATTTMGAIDPTLGVEARLTQTVAAAADASRGHARRSFALEQIAFRDQLTGLWSRRAFDDHYAAMTAGEITPAPTIVMIDIDRFKTVNDGFGHAVGDRTLINVAHCITDALRPDDFAARYAGDEFVVLLPNTSADLAASIGERIRSTVTAELADPSVTVSIGITLTQHADRRAATNAADRALYDAKNGGRNQVVLTRA
jgi:diguanylate cyclase (GGDEF)-like protein/PAS domain S-box-containing protein